MLEWLKRNFRQVLKITCIFFLIICCVGWYFTAYNDLRQTDDEVRSFFDKANAEVAIDYMPLGLDSVRIIRTLAPQTDSHAFVIFVHGAPGSSDAFYDYLIDPGLLKKAQLISYDRPGYGYSDYGSPLVDIGEQAAVISKIIQSYDIDKVVLVSHSYGGPIAAVSSVIDAENILAHIMLSPVADPAHEKIFFYSALPSNKLFRYLFSGAMQVASFEKMTHEEKLRDIERYWESVHVPTVLMHGSEDWLAPIENVTYLKNKLNPEYLSVDVDEGASHFIIWRQSDKVVKNILEYL